MKKSLLFILLINLSLTAFSQTTYVVNSTADLPDININDTVCIDAQGNCTLRAAIQNANKTSNKDTIEFDISGNAPFTITVTDVLQPIQQPIIIDGRTQLDYINSPIIEIDGSNLPEGYNGIQLIGSSTGSEIYALSIGGFKRLEVNPYSYGIGIYSTTGNHIFQSNYIGIKPDGTTINSNTGGGLYFNNTGENLIGGLLPNQGNLISGNGVGGITFEGSTTNSAASNNIIHGNLIGTDATGILNKGNAYNVQFINAPNNTLGGNSPEARNIISGANSSENADVGTGIAIAGTESYGNTITGNYIGTDITGTQSIPNVRGGIFVLFGAHNNDIGTDNVGEGNIISGNGFYGIYFQGGEATDPVASNSIKGNYIGVDATGNVALPNTTGILMNIGDINDNIIGGSTPNSKNIISGNSIGIKTYSEENNQIIGNYIGLNATGDAALPNAIGISLQSTSANSIIGGADPLERNIISGNSNIGLFVSGTSHTILNNYIGLNPAGDGIIKNGNEGLRLSGTLTDTQISENTISGNGTTSSSARNVNFSAANSAHFFSNKIGTLPDGNTGVANIGVGLVLNNSSNNIIGGVSEIEGNIIGNHNLSGVQMVFACSNNTVSHNKIGVGLDGVSDIGNGLFGIVISGTNTENSIVNNKIANNQKGVVLDPSLGIPTQVTISENSIYNNSNLGIHLIGTTANDVDDADTGVNNLQNTPEISTINYLGGNAIEITYAVSSSITNSSYPLLIEFFGAANGQGKIFIESDLYAAPGSKNVTINLPNGFDVNDYINIVATATDANGNTSEFGISIDSTLSIMQFEDYGFKLYPNPVSDRLFIKSPASESYNLEVVNTLGQLVLAQNNNASSTDLDVSNLSKGLYFLNMTSKNGHSETIKFIKN